MSGGADDEHVAQALVEDDFGGEPGVAATEEHDVRVLPADKPFPILDTLTGMLRLSRHETFVARFEHLPGRSWAESFGHVK